MMWKPKEFRAELDRAVAAYDRDRVSDLCDRLIKHLRETEQPYDRKEAGRVLDVLRRKRYFDLMQHVADVLIQSGQDASKIRRQYAQSQLDLGNVTAAIWTLNQLVLDTADDEEENAEARGLLGRAYKQLYVDANAADIARNREHLARAIQHYREVYESDREKHLWHGINSIALIRRADEDGIELSGIAGLRLLAQSIATEILARVEVLRIDRKAQQWDFATAVEACVALGYDDDALKWLGLYLGDYTTDAFELASTHRQLVEVWRLTTKSPPGDRILPTLKSALLKAAGGSVDIPTSEVDRAMLATIETESGLEKIFGETGLKTFKWFRRGMERAYSVARVRKAADGRAFGTGFLLRGRDLNEKLGDEVFFLTNAHVVSDAGERGALKVTDILLNFELAGKGGDDVRPAGVLWWSPSHELDATLLRMRHEAVSLAPVPIAADHPSADGKERAYIIGHPRGRDLEISLQDNIILDADDRFVHYRSPTEPGSSGSPVFNEDWYCIGLHHAGKQTMPRLHGEGTYPANEGIWISAIRRELEKAELR